MITSHRLQLAVHLVDTTAQAVTRQGLVRLRAELHGVPACLSDVSGPLGSPSCPEMRITSACAFATPAAIVPTLLLTSSRDSCLVLGFKS